MTNKNPDPAPGEVSNPIKPSLTPLTDSEILTKSLLNDHFYIFLQCLNFHQAALPSS